MSPSPPSSRPASSHSFRVRLGDRSLFPELEALAYLAHAAISPLSTPVEQEVARLLADVRRLGVGAFPLWARQREGLRHAFAELIAVRPTEVALTAGTNRGLTDVALALPLEAEDEIVSFHGEFPANIVPWQVAATRAAARLHLLPAPDLDAGDPDDAILEGLRRRLSQGARYVSVSAVQFQTGFRMPLKEIGSLCAEHGARFLVDAIQAVGALPLNATELQIDGLFVGAHKWLLGLEGVGLLYLHQGLREELRPVTLGWQSLVDGESFLFEGKGKLDYERPVRGDAGVFEGSTQNAVGFAALGAGLEICRALGPERIFDHVQSYHDCLEPELAALGLRSLRATRSASRSCLLSFDLPENVPFSSFSAALRAERIAYSTPDGLIRFAPHFANSLDECEIVAGAVARSLDRARA